MITLLAPLVAKFALQFGPGKNSLSSSWHSAASSAWARSRRSRPSCDDDRLRAGRGRAGQYHQQSPPDLRLHRIAERLDFLIAGVGVFGIGEILLTMEEGLAFKGRAAVMNPKVVWHTWKELPRYWRTSLSSCLIAFSIIAPVILVFCAIGAYTVHNSAYPGDDDAHRSR